MIIPKDESEYTDKEMVANLEVQMKILEEDCQALQARCDAMREVVDAAKDLFAYERSFNDFDHTYCDVLREALSKLKEQEVQGER